MLIFCVIIDEELNWEAHLKHIEIKLKAAIDMATFGEQGPTVVTRDSPCWIPGTAPMI